MTVQMTTGAKAGCCVLLLLMSMVFFTAKIGFATSKAAGHGLQMSNMHVKITSKGQNAVFQLYDTRAARELYDQLPLQLELSNFRDAQWMFYPPRKLSVSQREAYHDGKKGELSYYAPWGDVFMLYEDFYAGDEMHRLGIGFSGVDEIEPMSGAVKITKYNPGNLGKSKTMKIQVIANGKKIVYTLNDSQASKDLYTQLPLETKVEDYGGKEKIFYPPKKLGTSNTPSANAKDGTLAYYAPWGDVVMFYKDFGGAGGLYELGHVDTGLEYIDTMSGRVRIEKYVTN